MKTGCYAFGAMFALALGVSCTGAKKQPTLTDTVLGGEVLQETHSGDRPIEGAIVDVLIGTKVFHTVSTNPEGRFKIEGVPKESFNIRINKGDDYETYDHFDKTGSYLNAIEFGSKREWLSIKMEGQLTVIVGQVVNAKTGDPITDAVVRTYPGNIEERTDGEGRFEIRSGTFEADVEYVVEVVHDDYKGRMTDDFEVTIGGRIELPLVELAVSEISNIGTGAGKIDYNQDSSGKVTRGR